jgi:hypothetical protein
MTAINEPLPLRDTSAWGLFAAKDSATYIPHRYGSTGGSLIQYDRGRQQFVWADHAVESIDAVLVDGQPLQGWTWANVSDVAGHPVAMITLQSPLDDGATAIARGVGKLHPRTGVRMVDPAAIVWDVLANIAGRDVDESAFATFSRACSARNITAGGSIETADTAFAVAAAICESVGGVFSSPKSAALWPGVSPTASVATLTSTSVSSLTATARLSEVCNDLTVQFDIENSNPRATIQLECPDSIKRFGRRPLTIQTPWVVDARVALDVATRLLQQRARAQWEVQAEGLKRAAGIGQFVTIDHPASPVSGPHMVQSVGLTFATNQRQVTVSAPIGSVPAVRLVQQGSAYDPQTYASVGVQSVGNDRVITLTNTDGTPIAGASVLLDGKVTAYSDANGHAKFAANVMTPGNHSLFITKSDGSTLSSSILVL